MVLVVGYTTLILFKSFMSIVIDLNANLLISAETSFNNALFLIKIVD